MTTGWVTLVRRDGRAPDAAGLLDRQQTWIVLSQVRRLPLAVSVPIPPMAAQQANYFLFKTMPYTANPHDAHPAPATPVAAPLRTVAAKQLDRERQAGSLYENSSWICEAQNWFVKTAH